MYDVPLYFIIKYEKKKKRRQRKMDGEKNEFKIGIFISKSGSFNFIFSLFFFLLRLGFCLRVARIRLKQFLPSFIGLVEICCMCVCGWVGVCV